MLELQVVLDFACCACQQSMSVTVKCSGKGLAEGGWKVASVNVPCPGCSSINQLYFEPSGTIHAVAPYRSPQRIPEPSVN